MSYTAIEAHGVIGNLHSVALVGTNGSIDWCCLPRFDSPSVFAAILDDRQGGYFQVRPGAKLRTKQMYFPETNVLVTRFLSADGMAELIDFMPLAGPGGGKFRNAIVRRVKVVRGELDFQMVCRPAFDFARRAHELKLSGRTAVFESHGLRAALASSQDLRADDGGAVAEFSLKAGENAYFVFQVLEDGIEELADVVSEYPLRSLRETIEAWKHWVSKCQYEGRWREMVIRSALALKLMVHEPTGALVASPTCSLPEIIGGARNWDYRYTWTRDAAFTIYALLRLGYHSEAHGFMSWLQNRAKEHKEEGPLQVMYGLDGRHALPETTLKHLDGYRGSKPVRVGNAARSQLQLDIYGELTDSIYLYDKYAEPIPYDLWSYLRVMLDWVADNWERADHSIWETRAGPQHFLYSKMQCWVALDRGLRTALKRGLPIDEPRLRAESHRIYETIMREGWDAKRRTFVQHFGSHEVDASTLTLPLMRFVSPTDPRMLSTIDRILDDLVADSLVYRYLPGKASGDGLPGREGTFSVCSFWLVEAMARAGRIDEARLIFEKMLTYANHLGLYSEEVGPSGESLGNFPLALTHLGLISAAMDLERALTQAGRP